MSEGNFDIHKANVEPEKQLDGEEPIEEQLARAIDAMHDQLRETGKNLREVIPKDRNFEIELQEHEGRASIILKHKDNEAEEDLDAYLPPESFFCKDKIFIYYFKEKKIGFPENQLEFRGFLLTLFHEIGHAHEKRAHAITRYDTLKALWQGMTKWVKSIRIKKELQEDESGKKSVYRVTSLPAEALLPRWYLDKHAYPEAKSERDAWAYALRSLRKLEQKGYDVFAGFEDVAQIRAYVAHCLYTYDTELFWKKMVSGDVQGLQALSDRSPFWRKSKMRNRISIPDKNDGGSIGDKS